MDKTLPYELDFVRADHVETRPVEWIWDKRIPRGKLTLFVGDPDIGKSFTSMDITARITRGMPWPDGSGEAPKGRVMAISAEDEMEDTVVPRLEELGADLKKVHLVGLRVRRGETVEYLNLPAHLGGIIQELERRPTALMIIDPITAFTGRLDTHKNAEVRTLMMRLFDVASATGCAVFGITHWNKDTREPKSLYRITGSLAFAAAVRAVMAAGWHPEDEDRSRRVLVQAKHNLSSRPDAIEYSITDGGPGEIAKFKWGETLDLAADEMLIRTSGSKPVVDNAKSLLSGLLAQGSVPQSDVLADAKAAGIGESSLKKAKRELGVISERDGKAGRWLWRLPASASEEEGDAR